MNSIIRTVNLSKDYSVLNNSIRVLKNINIDIEKEKSTFILGPSGAGKSTLLHIMGSLDKPTEGEVYHYDKMIFNMNDKKMSKWRNENIGFIFQFHYLLNDFSAIENIILPAVFKGESFNNAKEKAFELMKKLKIENRMNHKPLELSGGEQQRVAVARAIINNPKIIFADEPTGNLDSSNTYFIMDFFTSIKEECKTTFVIITHNQDLVRYADSIIYLKDGIITKP